MSVERYDGERRIERVFRLVAFIKKGALFVLFGCGWNNVHVCMRLTLSLCVYVLDKPVLIEKEVDYHI